MKKVRALLCRPSEVTAARKPGRSTDAGKNMKEYETTLAPDLERFGQHTNLNPCESLKLRNGAQDHLRRQADLAEKLRLREAAHARTW